VHQEMITHHHHIDHGKSHAHFLLMAAAYWARVCRY
jgi:hypothetical protein